MIANISTYFVTLVSLIGLDIVFLGIIMRNFYSSRFGDLMKSPIDFKYALMFYVLYTFGIILFAILPGIQKGNIQTAMLLGGALGIIAYMTYDFTGAATIKGFPLGIIIIDVLWGGIATAIASGIGYQLMNYLSK